MYSAEYTVQSVEHKSKTWNQHDNKQTNQNKQLIVSNVSISGGRPLKINQSRQRVHRQTSDTSGVGDVSIKPPKIGSIYTRIQR